MDGAAAGQPGRVRSSLSMLLGRELSGRTSLIPWGSGVEHLPRCYLVTLDVLPHISNANLTCGVRPSVSSSRGETRRYYHLKGKVLRFKGLADVFITDDWGPQFPPWKRHGAADLLPS